VQNSAGTELFKVGDDGAISINGTMSGGNIATNYISTANLIIGAGSPRLYSLNALNANLSINTTGIVASTSAYSTSTASAVLEAASTTQGFLPPRMTTTQKNAIATPASGLQVYDSTVNRASVYSTAWENVITEVNASPNSVSNIWSGSQAQYDALTPNASTLYFIV